jgi:hypothetical protein
MNNDLRATVYEQRTTNDERAVRRQLFDDSMRGRSSVMGSFRKRPSFLDTTRIS